MNKEIVIGKIPFVFAPINTEDNPYPIPNSLMFKLTTGYGGVVQQAKSTETEMALKYAYMCGSTVTGQMDDYGNGKEYADEFLDYIKQNCILKDKNVLEIGCGTGYLLSQLQKEGATCIGIEPGECNVKYGRKKFGVTIIQDFFRKELFSAEMKFDVIVFYCVLEHIYNIRSFLEDTKEILSNDGKVFLGVPNSYPHLARGDISMLFIEHWNYFTMKSLKSVFYQCRMKGNTIESRRGGTLFGMFKKGNDELMSVNEKNEEFFNFRQKFVRNKAIIENFLETTTNNGNSLGVYVAWGFINWINICSEFVNLHNVRFIDDNPLLKDTFYPGYSNPIENYDSFMNQPTEYILIASYTYEKTIMNRIIESDYPGRIITIKELLS